MRILISGSTGLIGTSLTQRLLNEGHEVVRFVRPGTLARAGSLPGNTAAWDPATGKIDESAAGGADALVHLAGVSIADGRWNAARKNLLRTSRVDATHLLVESLAQFERPPRTVVSASAIGFFGDRGDEELTETSAPGNSFLAKACVDWEAEVSRASKFGARAVMLRFGIVLAANGGALPRMALPFKLGAGGKLGSGRQWMSWLTLDEALNIIVFALANSTVSGPVNAVTPGAVRNWEFTRVLAGVLRRPALFPAPAFALRLALGEMADDLLLSSQRVVPAKLQSLGYAFAQTDLRSALESVLRQPS
jgi:uncharacterized protein (TIGR01777 family)